MRKNAAPPPAPPTALSWTDRALQTLGLVGVPQADPDAPRAAGPTLRLVEPPDGHELRSTVDRALDALDSDTEAGRRVSRALEGQRGRVTVSPDGKPQLDGRSCCYDVAKWVQGNLPSIQLGELFRCRTCRAVWTVDNLVREERKHG